VTVAGPHRHQYGDQGRDLFGGGVAANHAQQRFGRFWGFWGWRGLIVVSGVCHHGPFSIKL
jgi:hypothetical protein